MLAHQLAFLCQLKQAVSREDPCDSHVFGLPPFGPLPVASACNCFRAFSSPQPISACRRVTTPHFQGTPPRKQGTTPAASGLDCATNVSLV
jgi:hypothetical protein